MWASIAAVILCVAAIAAAGLYEYGEHSWRFRVDSSDNIDVSGMQNVTKAQIMEVMGADIGRNIFFIPLVAAEGATRTDSVGRIGQRDALRPEPPQC